MASYSTPETTMAKSNFFPNYKRVADSIRLRIQQGYYSINPIPSERRLADEFDVNYMTVRRGLRMLETEGMLVRNARGRTQVKRVQQGIKKHLNIGFLMPTLTSPALQVWRTAIDRATVNRECSVRPILYTHWDDPLLMDSVEGFDGVFLNPIPEQIPDSIADRLRNPKHPVVVVDHDFSSYGIPSIRIFPPIFVERLLDHLASLGHTKIGCFNTQPTDTEVLERINQWHFWMAIHNFTGRLVDESVAVSSDPMFHAYEVMDKILSEPQTKETAWFFITAPSALGAMRAMLDHGLMPGRDIAVCTANGEGWSNISNPRLTALEAPDATPFITYCLNWMAKGRLSWQGPLLMQPAEIPLFIRESTQPDINSQPARKSPR